MSVRHYSWGIRTGGANEDGSAPAPAEASYGPPEKFSGTIGAAGVTITFAASTKSVTVRNTHDSAGLQYSLDGGATWFGMQAYGEKTENVNISSMRLRRATPGTAPTYEVIAILTE
jgi:hypothetical protein